MKKAVIWSVSIVGALVLIAGLISAYVLFLRPQEAKQLYQTALRNSVSVAEDAKPYASVDVTAENFRLKGQAQTGLVSKSGDAQFTVDIDGNFQGVAMQLGLEMVVKMDAGEVQSYLQYREVSSSDPEYGDAVEAYFQPVVGQWVKSDPVEDDAEAATFEDDGPLAAMGVFQIFAPIAHLSEADQRVYLDAVQKYNLYKVEEKLERSQFKGVDATKLRVSVSKEAYIEFDRELDQRLSDAAEYKRSSTSFIDKLFARDTLAADVYVDNQQRIMGVASAIELSSPVTFESYQTEFQNIDLKVFVEYDRTFTAKVPAKTITEAELGQLLEQ